MSKNSIFIAATGQNVGKTTVCLGIIAALVKRYEKVGFIKPVGQRHVKVKENLNVDKDAVLFKEHFHLQDDWEDMSPVIIPAGFTRSFLDNEVTEDYLMQKITTSFARISSQSSYTIVEGTGHVGVGSIVNLSNAKIAAALGLDMIIIAPGGLGLAFDELSLNIAMCQSFGVQVRGIILNRVLEDKREMIKEYFPKVLARWNIPLIGCIPFNEILNRPTMRDFEALFETSLLSGRQHHYRRFEHTRLVAGSTDSYEFEMIPNQLVITPASREGIIMRTLYRHEEMEREGKDFGGGMILTGVYPPSDGILAQIRRVDLPVLYAPLCSYDVMKMITTFIAKIRKEDLFKIEQAIALVEGHVNFNLFG